MKLGVMHHRYLILMTVHIGLCVSIPISDPQNLPGDSFLIKYDTHHGALVTGHFVLIVHSLQDPMIGARMIVDT